MVRRDDPKVKQNTQVDVEPQPVDTENDVPDRQLDPQIPASFQPENTQAGHLIQTTLQKRVTQLETELQATLRKLQLAQRQRLQALTGNQRLVAGLNKYLNEDQGSLDNLCQQNEPYIVTWNGTSSHQVSLMSPEKRHATLMVDELQLAPGLVYNPSSGTVLGAPTIPLADETLPPDCLATHGLVFMLDLEHESFEYLAGFVVAQVKKANSCQAFVEAITNSAEGNKLTMLKCYTKEKPA
ncbi:hypothetical protein HPB51_019237 [Rhipicephalus microplus]|uniref:Uncharacterized protein n=1 Tax=Rhipicephalus microplus TaxID=6941 RepID=A0A9J6E2K6_RHIMP|nr:hypothetical protein HPB51_019237 [Rhipicephalus microplus]